MLLKETNVISEWDWDKNKELGLFGESISAKSNKYAYWICKYGHKWCAVISSRSSGNGCPICSGQKILPGYNDLQTLNPTLATEWDVEKNINSPDVVSPNSHKKAWWKCKRGHSWEAEIKSRNQGVGCPICGKRKQGNSLIQNKLRTHKSLLQHSEAICLEWDYDLNDKTPDQYLPFSNKKVFWRCPRCETSYLAAIYSRTKYGTGCPKCKMSHGERIILSFLKNNNIAYYYQHKFEDCVYKKQLIFDFYIPNYKTAIEYDGLQHYKPIDYFGGIDSYFDTFHRDKIKDDYCKTHNINLIRICDKNPDKIFEILHKFFKNDK